MTDDSDSSPDGEPPKSMSFETAGEAARLVALAQDGDQAAVGQLLEAYRGYLRTIARRRMSGALARRVDPSDLVQQTMLEAHQGIDRILTSDQSHLRASLRKILTCNVANAIRDHLHADKRNLARECAGSAAGYEPPDRLTSPSMTVAKQETLKQFTELIDRLPKDQATAIRMRYFECASVGEIGEALGRSRVAAAGLLKRGLMELRKRSSADEP
ncbi:MAG: sigma-70 family RNA polymerase sigma factor [Pirellulales bacterium]|nr:sigma-70 family RNA polymerase sigma factor [Pirellulales bacterium]